MIRNQWLTGCEDLTAPRALRGQPDDGRDGDALHLLVTEDGRESATGRLYDAGGRFFIDMLAGAPEADPELMVLVVQLLAYKASELGAREIYTTAQDSSLGLLLMLGFMAIPPGDDPAATAVLRPGSGGCGGCGSCGGCGGCGAGED